MRISLGRFPTSPIRARVFGCQRASAGRGRRARKKESALYPMGCWGRLLFGKCGKTRGKKNSQIVRVNWHAVCSRMHPRIRIRGRSNDELELRRACYQNAVMRGWNGWYHCTCNTYGTWLRGDPRGWRTRHDRERVEGDYRHPSKPGTWERTYQRSGQLMTRSPVRLLFAVVRCSSAR